MRPMYAWREQGLLVTKGQKVSLKFRSTEPLKIGLQQLFNFVRSLVGGDQAVGLWSQGTFEDPP